MLPCNGREIHPLLMAMLYGLFKTSPIQIFLLLGPALVAVVWATPLANVLEGSVVGDVETLVIPVSHACHVTESVSSGFRNR